MNEASFMTRCNKEAPVSKQPTPAVNRYKADLRELEFLIFEQFHLADMLGKPPYDAWRPDEVRADLGTDEQRRTYCARLYTGQWGGTMCLTEPQAGSDVGSARTRARPVGDGTYAISGTKIFISGGDHDLADNIIHLVLARVD